MAINLSVEEIRSSWAIADAERDKGLTVPDDLQCFFDIPYGEHGKENLLDIYVQKDVTEKQPTIVNIHGGAWVYGSKEIYKFYCMKLAQKGFTVVNINYRLAPESVFPSALEDINNAMQFVAKSGEKYYADKDRIIIVGDSAGAQLTSHYSAILTNKDFSRLFGFELPDIKVKALGLNCGIYDGLTVAQDTEETLFRKYLGLADGQTDEKILAMADTMKNITPAFPPSFIMSCEEDFLLPNAEPMYRHLKALGIPVVMKIYGQKGQTEISHVFHINCHLDEAARCNHDECEFFRKFV
ncbi:MAG: alpha/beta hydrolase [Oscillospiraceae bacterium]|nr:alpha/beta hydrolase [Oscillospiraceae bacterium]